MYYVYVLEHSVTSERYIGATNDLKRRLIEHNNSGNKFTTRKVGKWLLVYAEIYRNKHSALQRENRLKNHGRVKQELFKRIFSEKD